MTTAQLKLLFEKNHVPAHYYSFDSRVGSDTYVLEHRSDDWLLYYTERGNRFEEQQFVTEDEACRAMLAKVQTMLRGGQHRDILTGL